jgi:hypothetical protein
LDTLCGVRMDPDFRRGSENRVAGAIVANFLTPSFAGATNQDINGDAAAAACVRGYYASNDAAIADTSGFMK